MTPLDLAVALLPILWLPAQVQQIVVGGRILLRARDQFEFPKAGLLLATAFALGFTLHPDLTQPVNQLALVWLGATLISTAGARFAQDSFVGIPGSHDGWIHQAAYVVLFLAAQDADPVRLAKIVVGSALLVAAYALVQIAGWDPYPWQTQTTLAGATRPRPVSTLSHGIHLGTFLAMVSPLALGLGQPWIFAFPAFVVVVLDTGSRSAWLGLAAGLLAYSLQGNPWGWTALALLTGGVLVASATLPAIRNRVSSFQRLTSEDRTVAYGIATDIWHRHPWFGVGPDQFWHAWLDQLGPTRVPDGTLYLRAHSNLLHNLATTGVVGTALALACLGAWALGALHSPNPWVASVVVYLVATQTSFHNVTTASLAAIGAGLAR